jgi:4-amino-4-deoxy-L-arabinose transferase-like glycosyltransferase
VKTGARLDVRRSAPLLAVLAVAAPLIFFDLGGPWLWEDEGDTAAFARNVLATGVPTAWDGRNFLDSDYGFRVMPELFGRDLVMVGTPWLPFYATAGSFALFGESNAAARLPFAIASLASVALLYLFVLRATGCTRAALAAAILLIASTQFLLYAREARSYGFNMFFTLLLLWGFLRLGERRRDPWLVIAAILLFHTQFMPAVVALAACGALALVHPRFRPKLVPLLWRAPWVMAGTLPWMLLTWSAVQTNWKPLDDALEYPGRVAQLAAETMVAVPWLGWGIGIPLFWRRFTARDRDLLAIAGAFIAVLFALLPFALTRTLLLVLGLRYVCALLPVAAAVTGVLVARASGGRAPVYALLLVLFGATHLAGNTLPWLALGEGRQLGDKFVFVNAPRALGEKFVNATWWYFVRGLGVPDPGTLPELVGWVRTHAAPEDILVTNFAWDNLYFYTKQRQGFRMAPEAPVRETALALGLPSYVFGLDGVQWLIWRHASDPLPEYPFERVRRELEARGAKLEQVASFREVLWENRPELHWHRFPQVGFPFAPRRLGAAGRLYPDAIVYRVVWP